MKTAQTILKLAVSYLGIQESPANSNNVQFNTDFYGTPVHGADFPWCCAFVWDMFRMAGASELFCGGDKTAWCPYVESYAKRKKQWVTDDYQPGDCMLFNFQGGTLAGHIGIVEQANADGTVTCIEGNTSMTSQDNGGEVMRRIRYKKNILGAFRPKYEVEREEENEVERYSTLNDVPNDFGFRDVINTLMDAQIIKGDGSDPDGNNDVIDLSKDQVRSLVFEYRGGAFDRKLISMGMTPAVSA